jgi:NMD protein affecting ribosome stability and mRNA decay
MNMDFVFQYHAPSESQIARYKEIREAAKVLAYVIQEQCPDCADKYAALRKVREAVMTANASIALCGAI